MRVLLIESSPGVGRPAADALAEQGHEAVTCYRSDAAFPCRGVELDGCPLDQGVVDVALLVRDASGLEPTPYESGVRCALRRGVPLALVGHGDLDVYRAHAVVSNPGVDNLVRTVEQASQLGLVPLADAAAEVVRRLLDGHGLDSTNVEVNIERRDMALSVTLRPGIPLEAGLAETASVRALAAVRGLDPQAAIIDVAVESPAAAPA